MVISGKKRWIVLTVISMLSGLICFVPYLRYSFYDQMVVVFSQTNNVVDPAYVNEFIGDMSMIEGLVCMIGYVFGGALADKFSEKYLIVIGGVIFAAVCAWFAFVPGQVELMIINALMGVGVVFIFSPYLKLIRKLGTENEQGKMFSTGEFVRNIINTIVGFLGSFILGVAIVNGVADPEAMGTQWMVMLLLCSGMFLLLSVITFIIVPADVMGAEEASSTQSIEDTQEGFSLKDITKAFKLPGVWLVAILIFFCYSFVAVGSGYLGAYTTNVLGIDATTASNYAVIRNYIIAALSMLLIGFVADKIGSRCKTLGIYLALGAISIILVMLTKNMLFLCIAITFFFAIIFMGMKGIYFATMSEVGIPVKLTGLATGIISLICYTPDVFFAKIAGGWIDAFGNAGYDYIWFYGIACGVLGVIVSIICVRYSKKIEDKKENSKSEA